MNTSAQSSAAASAPATSLGSDASGTSLNVSTSLLSSSAPTSNATPTITVPAGYTGSVIDAFTAGLGMAGYLKSDLLQYLFAHAALSTSSDAVLGRALTGLIYMIVAVENRRSLAQGLPAVTDWIPSFLDGLEPEDRKLFNDLSSSDGELLPLAVTAMHALDPEWRDKVSPLVQPAAAGTPGAAEVSDGTHIPASTATEGVGEAALHDTPSDTPTTTTLEATATTGAGSASTPAPDLVNGELNGEAPRARVIATSSAPAGLPPLQYRVFYPSGFWTYYKGTMVFIHAVPWPMPQQQASTTAPPAATSSSTASLETVHRQYFGPLPATAASPTPTPQTAASDDDSDGSSTAPVAGPSTTTTSTAPPTYGTLVQRTSSRRSQQRTTPYDVRMNTFRVRIDED